MYNVKSPDTVADLELGKLWGNLFQDTTLKPKRKRAKNQCHQTFNGFFQQPATYTTKNIFTIICDLINVKTFLFVLFKTKNNAKYLIIMYVFSLCDQNSYQL